jgi:hypothetical protein
MNSNFCCKIALSLSLEFRRDFNYSSKEAFASSISLIWNLKSPLRVWASCLTYSSSRADVSL